MPSSTFGQILAAFEEIARLLAISAAMGMSEQ
jgi:hypothetical protein